eukprot:6802133-Pyramimonas_sp.AAC.1
MMWLLLRSAPRRARRPSEAVPRLLLVMPRGLEPEPLKQDTLSALTASFVGVRQIPCSIGY